METKPPTQKITNLLQTRTVPSGLVDAPPSPRVIARRRWWKLAAFELAAVAAAAGLGLSCMRYLSARMGFGAFLAVAGIFLLASFFDFLLTRDPRRKIVAGLLQIAAFLAPFYAAKPVLLLSAFGILALFFLFAARAGAMALENSLKFSMWTVARTYMKKIFVGVALAVIVIYLPQSDNGSVFISQQQFQRWYSGAAGFAKGFYSELDFNGSVGAFAESIVRAELLTNAQFRNLPPEMQDRAVHESAAVLIASVAKGAGFPLAPETSLGDAFYRYLLGLFTKFREQFGQSFVAVWAVALFAIVWSLGAVFVWVVVFAAYLAYELLAAMGIVRLAGETRTKEVVELG